jgi:hypothetical protein
MDLHLTPRDEMRSRHLSSDIKGKNKGLVGYLNKPEKLAIIRCWGNFGNERT